MEDENGWKGLVKQSRSQMLHHLSRSHVGVRKIETRNRV